MNSSNGQVVSVRPAPRFDFNSYREFRDVVDKALSGPEVRCLVVDMGDVQYMDSAALGILLYVRDRAKASGREVELANCRGAALEVLQIANFQRIFTMR